jgi:hypothetical protein
VLKISFPQSASLLYRSSERRLSAKLVTTFADRGCHVVNVTDPYGCILDFLDRSRYFFFQVAPQFTHEAEWTPFETHCFSRAESSRSYFLADSQSVSQYVLVSSTLVGLTTRYYFLSECCLKFAVLYLLGALSDERTRLQIWYIGNFLIRYTHLDVRLRYRKNRRNEVYRCVSNITYMTVKYFHDA